MNQEVLMQQKQRGPMKKHAFEFFLFPMKPILVLL